MADIHIKRIYEEPEAGDGLRILVDRLWPRGLSKEKARVDYWARTLSPSTALRKWYGHDPAKWPEFLKRYRIELDSHPDALERLRKKIGVGTATLLYASTERRLNNAEALRRYLA